jgi:hypothetical protein
MQTKISEEDEEKNEEQSEKEYSEQNTFFKPETIKVFDQILLIKQCK